MDAILLLGEELLREIQDASLLVDPPYEILAIESALVSLQCAANDLDALYVNFRTRMYLDGVLPAPDTWLAD